MFCNSGEDNKPDFPGLTRGLVAVLLYYDGRRSLVTALRTLLLALSGRTWTLGLSPDLTYLTNSYVQKLVEENLANKILGKPLFKFKNVALVTKGLTYYSSKHIEKENRVVLHLPF